MQIGISTRFFRDERLTVDVLERFRKTGYSRIEIFANRPHFDFQDRNLIRSCARWFEENEVPPPSIHLPFEEPYSRDRAIDLPLFAPEERLRYRAIDELKRCLEFVEFTPVEYAVMHLGYTGQSFNPVLLDYAYAAIAAVQSFSGVKVMIENTLNEASTPDRIREFVAVAQLQDVGVCYDTGHGYLRNIPPDFLKIDALQLNDTHGTGDAHAWPFEGRINWYEFCAAMNRASFKGPLLFEVEGGKLEDGSGVAMRIEELCYEAGHSTEEYALKYNIKTLRNPENGETE